MCHYGRRKKHQYLVRWKGYPDSDNEWVDHEDMNSPEAIKDYERTQKDKSRLHSQASLPNPLMSSSVKKQPSQDVLHGDAVEEELGLAHLVSSYTLPHQNTQPGGRGRQTARSKVLSRRARDT